jgi:hypothetical protein
VRVLFFIEPVIFRNEPDHLAAHLPWAKCLSTSVKRDGDAFAMASNPDVCAIWRGMQGAAESDHICFQLDPFDPLGPFDYRRDWYATAVYGDGAADNPLKAVLRDIRGRFQPDIVVMTSQNAFARQAFAGLPTLHIEQAPLPRLGYAQRISIDPLGHQTNSLLEQKAPEIKQLPLAENDLYQISLIRTRVPIGAVRWT